MLQTEGTAVWARKVEGIDRQHPSGAQQTRQQRQRWCPSARSLTRTFRLTRQQSNAVVPAELIWILPNAVLPLHR